MIRNKRTEGSKIEEKKEASKTTSKKEVWKEAWKEGSTKKKVNKGQQ